MYRLRHEARFKQVFEHLLNIPPSQAIQSARTFPECQYDNTVLAWQDASFLEALSVPFNEKFFRLSTIGISNLMALAAAYRPGAAVPLIYTKETCEELHRLLCHLLRCYEISISTLSDFETASSGDDADEFEIAVYGVATCGLTLGALAHSTFIDEHMCRILPSNRREPAIGFQAGVELTRDAGSSFGRHAYADWLRSLVEHFEAAGELVRMAPHIRTRQISVEVVAVPQSGTSMRPWQQVMMETMSSSISMKSLNFTAQDAISAIEEFVSRSPNLSERLKGDMSLGRNFRGVVHSQACLASVIHRSDSGDLVSTLSSLVCGSKFGNS